MLSDESNRNFSEDHRVVMVNQSIQDFLEFSLDSSTLNSDSIILTFCGRLINETNDYIVVDTVLI